MKYVAPLLLASLASASPLLKRQESASASASASVASSVSSALGSQTVSASAAAPSGSQDFATGLLAALRNRQATTLASLVEPLAPVLGPVLQSGEWTLLAPGNEYLEAAVNAGFDTSNQTAVTELLSYHLVAGSYPTAALPENTSVVASTFLQAGNLGPNYTRQALVFEKNVFGTTNIVGQNISVLGNATYGNVLIKLIDGVLTIPGNITSVLASTNGANASVLLETVASTFPNTAQALATTPGLTLFAPSNAALEPIAGAIGQLASANAAQVEGIIQGHVLPQVVYSTNITDGLTATSLAGTPITLNVASTGGVTVSANGATHNIIRSDLIAGNGVVHVIDGILFDLGMAAAPAASSASGAASSAAASASA